MYKRIKAKGLPKLFKVSRKRDILLHIIPDGQGWTLSGTQWDEGSKSMYHMVDAKGRHLPLPPSGWNAITPVVILKDGQVLIETGWFQGNESTPSFIMTQATMLAVLGDYWWDLPLGPDTPLAIILDWLEENGHPQVRGKLMAAGIV